MNSNNRPTISDYEYFKISQVSYQDRLLEKNFGEAKPISISADKYFFIDNIRRDPDTGLDAYVFIQAKKEKGKWVKPKEPDNVIIGFAGTNPNDQLVQDVIKADGGNVVAGKNPKEKIKYITRKNSNIYSKGERFIDDDIQRVKLASGDYKLITKTSQFDQSDQLVREVKRKYAGPNTVISATGHSLGGAEADYAGVINGIYSVGFNNPSIVKLHDKETQQKIKNGDFRAMNKSIINPDDMVGAGWGLEYDQHNGTTIYTKDPSDARLKRKNRLKAVALSASLIPLAADFIMQALGIDDTHAISESNFKFDHKGNIINVDGSKDVYNRDLETMTSYANMDGQTIKVDKAVAKRLADQLNLALEELKNVKKEVEAFPREHSLTIYNLSNQFKSKLDQFEQLGPNDVDQALLEIAPYTNKGTPFFYDEDEQYNFEASLHYMIQDLEDIAEFIVKMAENLTEKDEELARWLKL
ncbi:lipase [Bacillus safensis]|uniref:lipase n=2 Tax=Bacillaceae TaxID=186817 RepID=UPI002DBA406A|nr:lipase [Bacillus safensis]MBY0189606.1 lipase [Bacillus aerophilus]MEC0983992.1 lipase [Bacillus safensis]MED1518883.1 lipase [Bacillus safensis]